MSKNKTLVHQLAEKIKHITDQYQTTGLGYVLFNEIAEKVVIEFGSEMFEEGAKWGLKNIFFIEEDIVPEMRKWGLIAEKEGEDE